MKTRDLISGSILTLSAVTGIGCKDKANNVLEIDVTSISQEERTAIKSALEKKEIEIKRIEGAIDHYKRTGEKYPTLPPQEVIKPLEKCHPLDGEFTVLH